MSRILIYSDRGGTDGAEQINHFLVVAFNRADHLVATAICQLADDPEQRLALGSRARIRTLAQFTEASMVHNWLNLLQSATAAGL